MSQTRGVTVLNFDHTYELQSHLKNPSYGWIDLSDLTGTMRFCDRRSLVTIQERLRYREKRGITLIGSGDYHYVSFLLLGEMQTPFTLVLFDNHPDFQDTAFSSLISCGSWVLRALEQLPMLKKVIIIGPRKELLSEIPNKFAKKITTFPNDYFPFIDDAVVQHHILESIPTSNMYISVDKDVLDNKYAVTNWDHGKLALPMLLEMIQFLAENKSLAGVDICGEYPFSPLQYLHREDINKITLNMETNEILLNTIQSLLNIDQKQDVPKNSWQSFNLAHSDQVH